MGSRRPIGGGSAGNLQLTAVLASILLVLLAIIRQVTLPSFRPTTGTSKVRYHLGHEDYVRRGPPHLAMRAIVAPLIVVSTTLLLGSGIALLVLGQTRPVLFGLHQASFTVWFGATSAHVLVHVLKVPRLIRTRASGLVLRLVAVAGAVVAGLSLAVATIPAADRLEDSASAHIGLRDRT